jgi:ribulose-bisphosphate carboxylase large chain
MLPYFDKNTSILYHSFRRKPMKIKTYTDLSYKPGKNDLVAEYYMEPRKGVKFHKAANHVAAESSIGTWTDITTLDEAIARKLRPSIYYMNKRRGIIRIAYDQELFEQGNMPQIHSSIAGNLFGMKDVANIRLLDIRFPKELVHSFKGPRYGIPGIRRLTRVTKRPLIGTIIKPKVGLDENQHAKVAYEAWAGGLDIVKDDENLSSMSFNRFEKRIRQTLKLRDRAEQETGEKKIYMANITAETGDMIKRAKTVAKYGGEYIMLDILTTGWAALQTVRDNIDQVIHAHRAGHAALDRYLRHGISMLTIAKCARLIGVDQIHVGTAYVGKMAESKSDTLAVEQGIEKQAIKAHGEVLSQQWWKIKPTLAVASGGLHPGCIPKLMRYMGKDIVMQFGGGCHWHPDGTRYGAMAIRQALEGAMKRQNLKGYMKGRPELEAAIRKYGIA